MIREAIQSVLGTPSYRCHARDLAATIRSGDGRRAAAERMWERIHATFTPAR